MSYCFSRLSQICEFKINQLKISTFNRLLSSTMSAIKRKHDDDDDNSNKPADELVPITDQKTNSDTKRKRLQLPEYSLDDSDYYVDNGLRKVYPYPFTYYSHCKGRWMGQELYSFYSKEFRGLTSEQLKKRIEDGLLQVNYQKVDLNYRLKGHDLLTHRLHRHELPVLSAPIPIIHSSDEMLVVDKPPSIPIHPCGKYRHNTVMHILAKEHKLTDLYNIHRLDRLTSGVLLIAKTTAIAQKLHQQIRDLVLEKQYVCRVEGKFPDGVITCEQPLETLSHKIGICIVDPTGKPSITTFERLNYNGKSSTVLCKPKTGRMHQIRVHLQYLGHPILNDSFYNNLVFGPQKGKDGQYDKTRDKLIEDIDAQHQRILYLLTSPTVQLSPEEQAESDRKRDIALKALKHYTDREEWKVLTENYKPKPELLVDDPDCDECINKTIDTNPKDLLIYLHAFCYKGPDWEYKTALPVWAQDDWDYD
ncbi:pseudouridylate synthase RPUSD2-like [Oppia nitens]|uniref:pseudouridylate synthase RPUSD2-like n=1 Tax=Oppia nitens TaxID=1686743 RepID=UPI0023DCA010|nr:pseudouridylate synthase RPUSD2-like [Oppia nitens]